MKNRLWGIVLVLFGLAASHLSAQTTGGLTNPAVSSAVKSLFDSYTAALLAGDVDRWLSLWDDNGVKLAADIPMFVGKPAIEKMMRAKALAVKWETFFINIQEVATSGSLAFARGTYTTTTSPRAGGASVLTDGKFLTVFVKEADGSWAIYRDCTNSNVPPGK